MLRLLVRETVCFDVDDAVAVPIFVSMLLNEKLVECDSFLVVVFVLE